MPEWCEFQIVGFNGHTCRDSGAIKYRADDRLYRKDKMVVNCIHAMAGLDEFYPSGGLFGTGFMMWGFNGTARVLIEYNAQAMTKNCCSVRWMRKKTDTVGSTRRPEMARCRTIP